MNAVFKALNVFPTYADGELETNSVKCFHIDINVFLFQSIKLTAANPVVITYLHQKDRIEA